MKKIVLIAFIIITLLSIVKYYKTKSSFLAKSTYLSPSIAPYQVNSVPTFSLLLPYWTLTDRGEVTLPKIDGVSQNSIDSFLYFGLSPTLDGINQTDEGHNNIDKFLSVTATKTGHKKLVLRLVNDTLVDAVLDHPQNHAKIASNVIDVAKKNRFDGIVLDLEAKGLPTADFIRKITYFVDNLSSPIKKSGLSFDMTIYGDVFYRARPFDLTALSPVVDHFYIMAYDFHKAAGDPGPNFPLYGQSTFGYDLTRLTDDLVNKAPRQKINVIFGLYGYDWIVDEEKRPIKPARAVTLAEIRKNFLTKCTFKNCVVRRDPVSTETEIDYIDSFDNYHIVWFEDETSIKAKIDYLRTKGINQFSYWAWGYY